MIIKKMSTWNGVIALLLIIGLAACAASIQRKPAGDGPANAGDTTTTNTMTQPIQFEQCEGLSEPVIYRNPDTDGYFLAIDSCMKIFFEALSLQSQSEKPKEKRFSNLVTISSGFPNNVFFFSEKLKVVFMANSENNVYRSIAIKGLGFKQGHPTDSSYLAYKTDIIPHLQVCCEPKRKELVACANLDRGIRNSDEGAYSSCKKKTQ